MMLNVALALTALGVTLVCGMPLVFRFSERGRWLAKMALSFVLGYVLLSLLGVMANLFEVDPFPLQTGMVLAGAALSVHYKERICGGLDRYDWLALGTGSLYLLFCLLFFDRIIMWMGGDAVAHASITRMLLEGEQMPVSVYPVGSYWEYYPKGFHLYSFYWAKAFPILNVVQTIPVLISATTPILLYTIVREMGRRDEALYTFILACFVFPAHYSYLIWAGYPTATAEMLFVASILALLVDRRLLPMLLLCMLFTHPRELVLVGGVLFAWAAATRLRRSLPYIILAGSLALIVAAFTMLLAVHPPDFLISIVTSQELASEYAARWYPAFLSLFGALVALQRRDQLDRLALAWTGAMVIIVLLADCGLLGFVGTADRLMLVLYLPLSLLAAVALSRMDGSDKKISASFMLMLLLTGTLGMGAVFYSYAGSWGLPQEDYDAIMWLSGQNMSDAICINPDETGGWVYPIAGIEVANQIMGPQMYYGFAPYNRRFFMDLATDPSSTAVIDAMKRSEEMTVLIYVSNVSLSRPGYVPPFASHRSEYPVLNLNFSENYYRQIYDDGARIFEFKNEMKDLTPKSANSWGWHVQWIGVSGQKAAAGSTRPGATEWEQYGKTGLYVDVDTSSAGFTETPIYITSLGGNVNIWRTTGATSVYCATPTGFRIYVFYGGSYIAPDISGRA
ncbi:MAG TPA: hypothetical protein PLM24_00200 [Methanothrix sp.]|nr:hypothetical protein [Methanothrix sp.]HPR65537.1 hypothetical protein [Methanothrix sp.]